MKSFGRSIALSGLVVAIASCASSAKLARQSDEALARGDLRAAYDRARRAVEKDPQNQQARDAYNAVSPRLADDYRRRVLALAVADTLAAADLAIEYRRFRTEVARHQTVLDPAPDYDGPEHAILDVAARVHYDRGAAAIAAARPKAAVGEFSASRDYDASFADVSARLDDAVSAATSRVVILPFEDGVGVPGLSREIGRTVQDEITGHASQFRFTRIVSGDEVERNLSVAEARDLSRDAGRDDAAILARRIGATRAVVGRFRGLRSSSHENNVTLPIYHRVDVKGDDGKTTVRWDEMQLHLVTREREVTVQYEMQVLDARTGASLARVDEPAHAVVRTAWTDFRPDKEYDRYALLPPDVRAADKERSRKADAQWREQMGGWELPELLRRARESRDRNRYSSAWRGEFYADTRWRPVWLGELPGENEMAFVALHEIWRPLLDVLKDLDSRD